MQEKPFTSKRPGEKIGWIGGGTGSVLWIGIMGIILLTRGETPGGVIGIALMIVGILSVIIVAPWRFPETRYWVLFIPLYSIMFLSVIWAIIFFEDSPDQRENSWSYLILIPILIGLLSPIFTVGRRKWIDKK